MGRESVTVPAASPRAGLPGLEDGDARLRRVVLEQIVRQRRTRKPGPDDNNVLLLGQLHRAAVRVELVELGPPVRDRGVRDGVRTSHCVDSD